MLLAGTEAELFGYSCKTKKGYHQPKGVVMLHLSKKISLLLSLLAVACNGSLISKQAKKSCSKVNISPCCDTAKARFELDQYGRPTIIGGDTDYEVFEMLGYSQASQRLTTMFNSALFAKGNVAEVYGPDFLSTDLFQRSMTYSNADLLAQFNQLPQRVKDILQGFTDGVNRFINDVFAGIQPMPAILNMAPNNILFKPGYQIELTTLLSGHLNNYPANLLAYPFNAYANQDLLFQINDQYSDIETSRLLWSDAMGLCAKRVVDFRTEGCLQDCSRTAKKCGDCYKQVISDAASFGAMPVSLAAASAKASKAKAMRELVRNKLAGLKMKLGLSTKLEFPMQPDGHGSNGVAFSGSVTKAGTPLHLDFGQSPGFPNVYQSYRLNNDRYDISCTHAPGAYNHVLDVAPGTFHNKKTGYAFSTNYTTNTVNTRDLVFETDADVFIDRYETFKVAGEPDVILPIYQSIKGGFTNDLGDGLFETIRNVLFWKKDILGLVFYEVHFAESFEDLQCKLSHPWMNDLSEANILARDNENRIFTYTMYAYQDLPFPKFTRMLPQDALNTGLADPLAQPGDYFYKPVSFNYNPKTPYYTTWNDSFDGSQTWTVFGRVESARSGISDMFAQKLVKKGNITVQDFRDIYLEGLTNTNHGATWNSAALNYGANNWPTIYKDRFTRALKTYGPSVIGKSITEQILSLLVGYDGRFTPACDKNDLFYGSDIDPRWVLTMAWEAYVAANLLTPTIPASLLGSSGSYGFFPTSQLVPTASDPLKQVRLRRNAWESVMIRLLDLSPCHNPLFYDGWLSHVENPDRLIVESLQQALSTFPPLDEFCTSEAWGKNQRVKRTFSDPTGLTDITFSVAARQMSIAPVLTTSDKDCKIKSQGYMTGFGGYSDLVVQEGDEFVADPHYVDLVTPAIVLDLPVWQPLFCTKQCEDKRCSTPKQRKLNCPS